MIKFFDIYDHCFLRETKVIYVIHRYKLKHRICTIPSQADITARVYNCMRRRCLKRNNPGFIFRVSPFSRAWRGNVDETFYISSITARNKRMCSVRWHVQSYPDKNFNVVECVRVLWYTNRNYLNYNLWSFR